MWSPKSGQTAAFVVAEHYKYRGLINTPRGRARQHGAPAEHQAPAPKKNPGEGRPKRRRPGRGQRGGPTELTRPDEPQRRPRPRAEARRHPKQGKPPNQNTENKKTLHFRTSPQTASQAVSPSHTHTHRRLGKPIAAYKQRHGNELTQRQSDKRTPRLRGSKQTAP